MKRLILLIPLAVLFVISGCGTEGTKDGKQNIISVYETVTNPFFIGTKAEKTLTEIIVELTTLISEKTTHREVEQTTHTTEPTVPARVADMVEIINNYRIKENLNQIKLSDFLCEIAGIRAEEASVNWSHTRPNGQKIDSLFNGSNIHWTILGENLARHKNAHAEAIVDAWMNSESHRENLLNPRYKFCGIAEYQNDEICYISLILTD